jgi:hypothetical protein
MQNKKNSLSFEETRKMTIYQIYTASGYLVNVLPLTLAEAAAWANRGFILVA